MTLQSKSFIVSKGGTLESVTQFLEEEIGLNAYLVKNVKAVPLSTTQTQITLLYEKYNENIIESIAPREGAIFNTGLAFDDFDLRFMFNDPIDYRSIQSGTFLIDGVGLDTGRVYLDTGSNNYFLKVLASGSSFQTEDFHTYQVSTTNLRRQDGSSIDYGPVGGYVFHSLSNAHIGDYTAPYVSRRRGKVGMSVVRLPKSIDPQQAITEFLSQRQISNDRLISYTPVSVSESLSDVYFIYISKLEPQIISGFPLNNSLLPDVSAPGKVTFVFNTPLDKAKLTSTDGLFSIESDFSTSTLVPASDVTLLDDLHTVEIDTSSYFTEQKIYSIIARPGLLGLDGLSKQKPEQWTIHISAYDPSTAGGGGGDVTQAEYDYLSGLFDTHTGISQQRYTEFTGHTGDTGNPHETVAVDVTISDSNSYYLGTNVEAALQEIGLSLTSVSSGNHTQVFTATQTVDIEHNLGTGVTIQVLNTGGRQVEVCVTQVSADLARLDFEGTLTDHTFIATAGVAGIGVSSNTHNFVNVTADYSPTSTDGVIYADASAGNLSINLPAASTNLGRAYIVKKMDSTSNTVTVDGYNSEEIDGSLTAVVSTQYTSIEVHCDGSSWSIL